MVLDIIMGAFAFAFAYWSAFIADGEVAAAYSFLTLFVLFGGWIITVIAAVRCRGHPVIRTLVGLLGLGGGLCTLLFFVMDVVLEDGGVLLGLRFLFAAFLGAVGWMIVVAVIAAVLSRRYPVIRVLFGGVLCLLGLNEGFAASFDRWLSLALGIGMFLFGGWMIISGRREARSQRWVIFIAEVLSCRYPVVRMSFGVCLLGLGGWFTVQPDVWRGDTLFSLALILLGIGMSLFGGWMVISGKRAALAAEEKETDGGAGAAKTN